VSRPQEIIDLLREHGALTRTQIAVELKATEKQVANALCALGKRFKVHVSGWSELQKDGGTWWVGLYSPGAGVTPPKPKRTKAEYKERYERRLAEGTVRRREDRDFVVPAANSVFALGVA
jgi:hypothetical protein